MLVINTQIQKYDPDTSNESKIIIETNPKTNQELENILYKNIAKILFNDINFQKEIGLIT